MEKVDRTYTVEQLSADIHHLDDLLVADNFNCEEHKQDYQRLLFYL